MIHGLCQVVAYPPLLEDDELKVRETSSPTDDTSFPLIKYVLDDVSSSEEDIDWMEEIIIDQFMEQTNEEQGKVKSFQDVNNESLMEQVQPPFMGDCDHEDKEFEFPLFEQDDYPSLCIIKDPNHLENEDIEDVLTDILLEESQVTVDHI